MSSQPPQPPLVPPDEPRPLADRIPGAVSHDVYAEAARLQAEADARAIEGLPPMYPAVPTPPRQPSGWNLPAFVMLGVFLAALTAVVWPQVRARTTEGKVAPVITGLAHRETSARCPRYLTTMFGVAGSVSFDSEGNLADRTDLTAPVCDGLRRFYTPEGKRELDCLSTSVRCSQGAVQSIVALSVVAHESMHLRGILDEGAAECTSISEGPALATLTRLTEDQGRMIAYMHLVAMNPNTPQQYAVNAANCPGAAELLGRPPGTPVQRGALQLQVESAWQNLGE